MQWSIRNLLNPVIARCLIYGTNPFDLEYVLRKMEEKPLLNSKMLEETWMKEWQKKAQHFIQLANEAREKDNMLSVSEYYTLAARCYYACYLLNSDEVENKKQVYENLAASYHEAVKYSQRRVCEVSIPFKGDAVLPAYLHLPDETEFKAPYPCVIIYSGMGACKEELEVEAKPLIERGAAVLTVDMPGTGAALFHYNTKLNGTNMEHAFDTIMEFCKENEFIDADRIGTYGLCMGGGFAYRAAAKYPEVKCCINLFPLFLSMADINHIPRWMKQGKWASFQMGEICNEEFLNGMAVISEGNVSCHYLLVHSQYDNWMELEQTNQLYEKSTGKKEEIIITEQPVYATKESVMHAMPVGEQMHWIKRKAADYCIEAFRQ